MRLLVLLVIALLLAGCGSLGEPRGEQSALVKPPESPAEAVLIADDYVARGRWQAALDVLDVALLANPNDATLLATRDRVDAQWEHQEQLLEDRISIGDAENQQSKIALLEKLSRAAPNDLLVASRRLYWKEVLRAKAQTLTDCAERHVDAVPSLAERCYRIAVEVVADEALEARLAMVRSGLEEGEELAGQRRRLQAQKERQLRAKVLLDEAHLAISANDYRKALDLLDQVAAVQPNNPEVEVLQATAWSMISPQIEALVKLGDHLYLDEQLTAAIATWQAALNLKPGDPEIAARVERARVVIDRLQSLRQRQRPPSSTAADSVR